MSTYRFNPPPGWPAPPPDWTPPEGWEPDPSWPPAPEGWQWWMPEPAVAVPPVVHGRASVAVSVVPPHVYTPDPTPTPVLPSTARPAPAGPAARVAARASVAPVSAAAPPVPDADTTFPTATFPSAAADGGRPWLEDEKEAVALREQLRRLRAEVTAVQAQLDQLRAELVQTSAEARLRPGPVYRHQYPLADERRLVGMSSGAIGPRD